MDGTAAIDVFVTGLPEEEKILEIAPRGPLKGVYYWSGLYAENYGLRSKRYPALFH